MGMGNCCDWTRNNDIPFCLHVLVMGSNDNISHTVKRRGNDLDQLITGNFI